MKTEKQRLVEDGVCTEQEYDDKVLSDSVDQLDNNLIAEYSFKSHKRCIAGIAEIQMYNNENHDLLSEYGFIKINLRGYNRPIGELVARVSRIMHGEGGLIEYNKEINAYRCIHKESNLIPIAAIKRDKTSFVIIVQANKEIKNNI